jgi:hypothetical protein
MADLITFNEYAAGGPIEQINAAAGSAAVGNMTFGREPLVTDDINAGYIVGSRVFNNTAGILRWWKCRDNTAGAAKWVVDGVDYQNGGTNPNYEVTQFGLGTGLMAEEGNIYREVIASRNPAVTNQDTIIALFTLPANSFDTTGRGINIMAQGSVANNTNSKRIKIFANPTTPVIGSAVSGGTLIADTGAYTTALTAGWCVEANVFKYGAAGSNTQLAIHVLAQIGAQVGALIPPSLLTIAENSAIPFAVTGNAVTTATDIVQNFFEINALN